MALGPTFPHGPAPTGNMGRARPRISTCSQSRLDISTTMAKKDAALKKAAAAAQAAVGSKPDSEPLKKFRVKSSLSSSVGDVVGAINATYKDYLDSLTPRLKTIDTFLVFLVALGVLQFVYVLLVGNFPFNAFLGGFISCVGQFVLTVSLRMHYAGSDGPSASPERGFAEYVLASVMLHFIVFHFIN
ncbi:DAD family protein [Clavispora lusitaniae]|uniref:Dolichyl-diphosphooligosaccharide--protein glycosyltransferase subunit OST2 n=1 Tax=Clavispora lusitaniae (strain ATCC 42720) TaxID=306902 RepID=C4Y9S7_CLAL4|nr:uncharacterized protein CLUG_05148 [Clavispora lusitaniae ATCC 42720]EEQ41020.1 hypothetical protein CLUG_05148 [Clavispora lusitaniae ATCC 42720]KAF7580789.1 DAD family protein [Clavispora lusitaniae]